MSLTLGRYELLSTIASGGMATVCLARVLGEGGFERLVAVKVMHPHIAKDPEFRAMFLDEARLAARIRHPHVIGVLDVQSDGGRPFLVMDYIDGPSLMQLANGLVEDGWRMPVEVTLRIFVDMLTGLHHAHKLCGPDGRQLQLIHRDVSPHNILIGRDGMARITDFGVARAEARLCTTRGDKLKGKIAYMSPEQLEGRAIDQRADLYSAGCALWEILSGRPLFQAATEAALVLRIVEGVKLAPSQVNIEVPRAIDRVCMKALRRVHHRRHISAEQMADELEEAAEQSGLTIATHRQVAAFLRSLPRHAAVPQNELPPLTSLDNLLDGQTESGQTLVTSYAETTTNSAIIANAMLSSRPEPWWFRVAGVAALLGVFTGYLVRPSDDESSRTTASDVQLLRGGAMALAAERVGRVPAFASIAPPPASSVVKRSIEVSRPRAAVARKKKRKSRTKRAGSARKAPRRKKSRFHPSGL